MRILVVAGTFAPNRVGGGAHVAEQTATGLRDRGHAVYVVTGMPSHAPDDLLRWDVAGIPVVGIGIPAGQPAQGPAAAHVASSIERIARTLRPDIIHVHAGRYLGTAALAEAVSVGPATVVSFDPADPLAPVDLVARADAVVVSGEQAREALPNVIPAGRVRVVPNGAAAPGPDWQHRPRPGSLRFGYIGGLADAEGYSVLVAALQQLGRSDYELHAVDRATLRGVRSIREWDFRVPGLLRLVPGYTPTGRDAFFGGIDALLSLPQHPGGAGLTVREALQRGVWPIASHLHRNAEVITDTVNGRLVPMGSASALAEAIGWALDHPEALASAPSAAAIPDAAAHAAALDSIYRELVAGR